MQLWQSFFGSRRPMIPPARRRAIGQSLHSIGGALKARGYLPDPRYLTGKPAVVTTRKWGIHACASLDNVIQLRSSARPPGADDPRDQRRPDSSPIDPAVDSTLRAC